MKMIKSLLLLLSSTFASTYFNFSNPDLKNHENTTITPRNFPDSCLSVIKNKLPHTENRRLRFKKCDGSIMQQFMYDRYGSAVQFRLLSKYYLDNPRSGKFSEMCVTLNKRGAARKVDFCRTGSLPYAKPTQTFYRLFEKFGRNYVYEGQFSTLNNKDGTRKCLNLVNNRFKEGDCDTSNCNTNRDPNHLCSSCGWRNGLNESCEYCKNKNDILTDDGNCIDPDTVTKCTEKFPMGSTFKTMQWYHPQGFTYCTECDPADESKCAGECPQTGGSSEIFEGHCRCTENATRMVLRKGTVVNGFACGTIDNVNEDLRKESCINNRFQTLPETKCTSCGFYSSNRCSTCAVEGAEVYRLTVRQGGIPSKDELAESMRRCGCPEHFHYEATKNKCVCSDPPCARLRQKGKRIAAGKAEPAPL